MKVCPAWVYLVTNSWNFRGNICDVSQSWGWKILIKIVPFSGLEMGGISHISMAKKRRASKSHLVAFLSDWRVGSVRASAQISKCRPLLSILKQMAESQCDGRGQWQIWSHGWISTPVTIGPVYPTCGFFPLALDYWITVVTAPSWPQLFSSASLVGMLLCSFGFEGWRRFPPAMTPSPGACSLQFVFTTANDSQSGCLLDFDKNYLIPGSTDIMQCKGRCRCTK